MMPKAKPSTLRSETPLQQGLLRIWPAEFHPDVRDNKSDIIWMNVCGCGILAAVTAIRRSGLDAAIKYIIANSCSRLSLGYKSYGIVAFIISVDYYHVQ